MLTVSQVKIKNALESVRSARKYADNADTDAEIAQYFVVERVIDLLEAIAEHLIVEAPQLPPLTREPYTYDPTKDPDQAIVSFD